MPELALARNKSCENDETLFCFLILTEWKRGFVE